MPHSEASLRRRKPRPDERGAEAQSLRSDDDHLAPLVGAGDEVSDDPGRWSSEGTESATTQLGQWGTQGSHGVSTYGQETLVGPVWRGEPPPLRFEPEVRLLRRPEGPRTDEVIGEETRRRIAALKHVDTSDVAVSVKQGEVTLVGTIPNRVMKWQLEILVESVRGVVDISNQLKLRRGK